MPEKIGIFPNLRKQEAIGFALELASYLREQGIRPLVRSELKGLPSFDFPTFPPEQPDFALSLGGDGTLLQCIHRVWDSCPVLGVNLGNMGFLTASDRSKIYGDVRRILTGEYLINERDLVEVRDREKAYLGLNECSIAQVNVGRIFTLSVEINGINMGEVRGDGLIVSTATGSTAYALACNGPLISPSLRALLLCVISPHSLSTRPLVLLPSDRIKVSLPEGESGLLVMDGQETLPIRSGEEIHLTLSPRRVKLVFFEENFFLRLIPQKLFWGHP